MHFRVILRILGILLMLFSFSMIPAIVISWLYADATQQAFIYAFLITFMTGFLIWLPVCRVRQELRTRDGFIITVLFWSVLGLFGALPFMFAEILIFTDALFESISGLTTTGATVIVNIDQLPESILFYRQQLQWMGGMGIIVLAVAILPMLGVGGMQLYRAEAPGPVKDNKLTPRITETAKQLWYIYLSLTLLCFLGYWLAGMTAFDAICHSFSTIAIGGFSTHDASIGYFNNPAIEMVAIVFMLISAVNFALHFHAVKNFSWRHYSNDSEFKLYISILLVVALLTCSVLVFSDIYDWGQSLRMGTFTVVSVATTTGFVNADFSVWPSLLPFLLLITAFSGACAGSTGGGIKVIRVLIIIKQGLREIKRLIHPNAIILIKLGNRPISNRVVEAVWGFFSVYLIAFVLIMTALLATGLDHVTAWSAVGATLNNLGPGLGDVALHYGDISNVAKWILCFAMLLGRLEVFTLLVLLTPIFWRH